MCAWPSVRVCVGFHWSFSCCSCFQAMLSSCAVLCAYQRFISFSYPPFCFWIAVQHLSVTPLVTESKQHKTKTKNKKKMLTHGASKWVNDKPMGVSVGWKRVCARARAYQWTGRQPSGTSGWTTSGWAVSMLITWPPHECSTDSSNFSLNKRKAYEHSLQKNCGANKAYCMQRYS